MQPDSTSPSSDRLDSLREDPISNGKTMAHAHETDSTPAPLPWLAHYPQGVPAEITAPWGTLVRFMDECFRAHAHRPMLTYMGQQYTFAEIDEQSRRFAAWLQGSGLGAGDRVALMMPNIPQYPIAIAGVLRAGMVVVNVNPLYTPRELRHQLKDSGARAIVVLENFAQTLEKSLTDTDLQHVLITAMGDWLPPLKRQLVNSVIRHVKKLVPAHGLHAAVHEFQVHDFRRTIRQHAPLSATPARIGESSVALLQYTGGTTGVSKGATLIHRNVCHNIAQIDAWFEPVMKGLREDHGRDVVCALPLYHIFALTGCFFMGLKLGLNCLLIPNPRDPAGMVKALRGRKILMFPGVNTLFNTLLDTPGFQSLDFSHLRVTIGGGMAVQSQTARRWFEVTGCPVAEGYGLSETSPVVSLNRLDVAAFTGTIGMPLPSTVVSILDESGHQVAIGERGEICVRGPQVMAGYWRRPDETAKVMTSDGHFRTGDIGVMNELGQISIVDRKKDMVLVSGFNVYPSEVEEVINQMPGILESAVIGVPDARSGEAVQAFVVLRDPGIAIEAVRAHCEQHLTAYKRPKHILIRADLPKSPVGKILRRELRDAA